MSKKVYEYYINYENSLSLDINKRFKEEVLKKIFKKTNDITDTSLGDIKIIFDKQIKELIHDRSK